MRRLTAEDAVLAYLSTLLGCELDTGIHCLAQTSNLLVSYRPDAGDLLR